MKYTNLIRMARLMGLGESLIHCDGKPLNVDMLFKKTYELARSRMNSEGSENRRIVLRVDPETEKHIVEMMSVYYELEYGIQCSNLKGQVRKKHCILSIPKFGVEWSLARLADHTLYPPSIWMIHEDDLMKAKNVVPYAIHPERHCIVAGYKLLTSSTC